MYFVNSYLKETKLEMNHTRLDMINIVSGECGVSGVI
jgi:hypothetical protein